MRYDEFSIHVSWREPNKGAYPRVATPGFYLTMGFANEASAEWIADRAPLSFEQVLRIAQAAAPGHVFSTLTRAKEGYCEAQAAYLRTLYEHRAELDRKIAAMEAVR